MEFESPDVEKDFPGLYASESGKKSNESDFSDVEGKDKHSKKEILIGKRSKEKKESKKDRGYAALEGESSPEEEITDAELKSPSKSKKTKSFKFPSKKDKQRDKHKDKENKEKEPKELKEKDGKVKAKLKEKKKSKHVVEETVDISEQAPVFGVSLSTAIERSGCHDGVQLPLVVRDCIDYLEEHGLKVEGIHRSLGMRAKVQQLRKMYNQREEVSLSGHEMSVVTSLLKQFFRELPEPVVSKAVEEAATAVGGSSGGQNLAELTALVQQLPAPNRTILAWILTHMEHIVEQEKHNRMGLQNVSLVVGPMLMVGQRALAALFNHRRTLFGEVTLKKYKPPLSAGAPCPDSAEGIEEELAKQESLLGQIHREMNAGIVSKKREEQLWEVQRFVTNLKRKLRLLQRTHGSMHKSQEEEDSGTERVAEGHRLAKGSSEEADDFKMNLSLQNTQQSIDEDAEESEKKEEESHDKSTEEPIVASKTSEASRGEPEKPEVGDGHGKEEVESVKPIDKADEDEVDAKLGAEELKKTSEVVKEILTKENESVSKDVPEKNIEEETLPEISKLPPTDVINPIQESKAARMAAINALSRFTQEELDKAAVENEQIMYLKLEHEELLKFKDELQSRIKAEKLQAKKLISSIRSKRSKPHLGGPPSHPPPQLSEASELKKEAINKNEDDAKLEEVFNQLKKENETLEHKASTLTRLVFEEREACIRTKVQLSILQMRQSQSAQLGV